jgi:hypothetical protein
MFEMSMEDQLAEKFGYWDEHPKFSFAEWQEEVANNNTRRSYWDWCVTKIDFEVIDEEDSE